MALVGADIAALRRFASLLRERARLIETTVTQLSTVVEDLPWHGADRERFVREWQTIHRPGLLRLVLDMRDGSTEVSRSATAQENASRVEGGW